MLAEARRRVGGGIGRAWRTDPDAFRPSGLTAAEADVALIALNGCDVAKIVRLRDTATGTVCARN